MTDDAPSAFGGDEQPDDATKSEGNPASALSPPPEPASKPKKKRNPMEQLIHDRRLKRLRELHTTIDEVRDKYERVLKQHGAIRQELLEVPMEKVRFRCFVEIV